jgi:hypothetical protein
MDKFDLNLLRVFDAGGAMGFSGWPPRSLN